MSRYYLQSWEIFEQYLVDTFKFKKTIRSGAIFGDCDMCFDKNELKLRIEAKYSKNHKNFAFELQHYLKAKQQSKPGEIVVIAYGNPMVAAKIYFAVEYTSEVARLFTSKEVTKINVYRELQTLAPKTILEATDEDNITHKVIILDELLMKHFIDRYINNGTI